MNLNTRILFQTSHYKSIVQDYMQGMENNCRVVIAQDLVNTIVFLIVN